MSAERPWLAVIDLQQIFAAPDSDWAVPRFGEVLAPVRQLVAAARDRVSFTRFLAPAEPAGAWQQYYRRWPFALQPPDAPCYQLVDGIGYDGRPTIDSATFGKWVPQLAEQVGPGGRLLLAGVSTECCVLSTALAAADAGIAVAVVAQACAAVDDASQQQALQLMAGYAPLIEVVELSAAITELAALS